MTEYQEYLAYSGMQKRMYAKIQEMVVDNDDADDNPIEYSWITVNDEATELLLLIVKTQWSKLKQA